VFEPWPFLIERGLAVGALLVLSLIVAQQVAKGRRSELSRKRRYTGLKMPYNLVQEMITQRSQPLSSHQNKFTV
jgi:hypothetical protein